MQAMSDADRREVHPSHEVAVIDKATLSSRCKACGVVLGTGLTVTLAATALCDPQTAT